VHNELHGRFYFFQHSCDIVVVVIVVVIVAVVVIVVVLIASCIWYMVQIRII